MLFVVSVISGTWSTACIGLESTTSHCFVDFSVAMIISSSITGIVVWGVGGAVVIVVVDGVLIWDIARLFSSLLNHSCVGFVFFLVGLLGGLRSCCEWIVVSHGK